MKKYILYFSVYIAGIVLIYTRAGMNIFAISSLSKILGYIIFILMTSMLIYLVITQYKIDKKIKKVPQKVQYTELQELLIISGRFSKMTRNRFGTAEKVFQYSQEAFTDSTRMADKYEHVKTLLLDSFSETDLTYITYLVSFEEVLNAFISNMKNIDKRIRVFDYVEWERSKGQNPMCNDLIKQIGVLVNKNREILTQTDNLLMALINLGDSEEYSLDQIGELIEQTRNYSKITED